MDWLMQKQTSNILLLLLLFWASPALCQDFIMAKVLSVDSEKMELVVVSPANPDKQITVRLTGKNNLPLNGRRTVFPSCVAPGETIRLWGSSVQTDVSLFFATDIRGCKSGGCSDPTGVRSRLQKIWKYKRDLSGKNSHGSAFGSNGETGKGYGGGHGAGSGGGGNGNGGGNGGGGGGR